MIYGIFVELEINGTTENSTVAVGTDSSDLSQTNVIATPEEAIAFIDGKSEQTKTSAYQFVVITEVPYHGGESSETFSALLINPRGFYQNNTLSELDFDLREDLLVGGYEFQIREAGGGAVYWSSQDVLEWCLTFTPEEFSPEEDQSEAELAELFNIDTSEAAPASLAAAGSWDLLTTTSTNRITSCPEPFLSLILAWNGMDQAEVMAKVDELLAAGEPKLSEVREAIFTEVPLIEDIVSRDLELVVDISINEFAEAAPFVFALELEAIALDAL